MISSVSLHIRCMTYIRNTTHLVPTIHISSAQEPLWLSYWAGVRGLQNQLILYIQSLRISCMLHAASKVLRDL